MKTFTLQILAFLMCMLCGVFATLSVLNKDLEGIRLILANTVSIGCLPLGLFIAYTAYQEHKTQVLE